MSGNIVIDWADSILEIAKSSCGSGTSSDKDKAFMEIIGICDAIFKSLGYACEYVFIKYKRFFDKLAGKDTTVIDWVLSVVDLAVSGIKYEYSGKDENLRCIIGVCKTIEITLGYVYANDSDAESKRKQGRSRRQYAFGLSILYNPCKKGPRNSGPFLASAFNLFHQIIDDVTSLN